MNRSIRHTRGRNLTAFLAIIVMMAGMLSVSMTTAAAAGSGTISGKVTKPGGGALANIDVTLYEKVDWDGETWWEPTDSTGTGSDGTYSLLVPAGTYRLGFDDYTNGAYAGEYYDNAGNVDEATDVVVADGATAAGKNAELAVGGRITGKVTKPGAVGLAEIDVTAYELVDGGDGDQWWEEVGYGWTGSDGTYAIGGLPTGTYRVGFDDFEKGNYAGEYYNNKSHIEDAANIAVTAGATASGKNAELAIAGHITGKVTAPGGVGLAEIEVSAYQLVNDPRGAYWDYVTSTETGTVGTYDLGGLKAGTYRIGFADYGPDGFASEYFDNKTTIGDAANVVVAAGATAANKNAELANGSHITGTVTDGVGTGLADIAVLTYAKLGDGSWEEIGGSYTEPDGTYDIGGLPAGTYRLGFIDYDSENFATEYFDNKSRVDEATDIVVGAGTTVADKNAELGDAAHITGTVTKAGGAGIADVDVVAYELRPDGEGGNSWQEAGYGFTGADGAYDIGGLPAGTYRIGFKDFENNLYTTEYFDDKKSVGEAADIVLGSGATASGKDAELAVELPDVVNTVAPTVTGTPKVGQTLTAKTGTWTPTGVTFTYEWLADGEAIAGATATTYKPVAGDLGKKISVAVTGAKAGHDSASKTSIETAAVTPGPLVTPKNLRSTAQTSSSLTLAWDAVLGAPKYRVQISKSSTMSSPKYVAFDSNSGTVTGLSARTKYYFRVSVVDANNSARLTPYTTTPASSTTKPYEFAAPTGLTSTDRSSTSLTLGWNAVAGAPAYRVQVSKSSTMSSPTYVAFDSNSGTVTGLAPNTKYYFRISVTSADHSTRMSSYTSTPVSATTKLYDFAAPGHLASTGQSSTTLSLGWDAIEGAPAYRIQLSKYADMSGASYKAFASNSGVITGLAPNTMYYFRVAVAKADNSARLSDYSPKPAPSARTLVVDP